MIRSIMKDVLFLNQPSIEATQADDQVVQDLMDTLRANEKGCVGLAANMIGIKKRIIAINIGVDNIVMINPVIVKKSGPYETEEGCLSLLGVRKTTRFQEIELEYLDRQYQKQRHKYSGYISQIIQHEVDHCNGIII